MSDTFTPAQKAEAVRLYPELGTAETARRIGCSGRSVLDWVAKAGNPTQEVPKKVTEARAARVAQKREYMRELLLERSIDFLERLSEDNARHLSVSVGILIDKYRLEMGEATQRSHVEGADDIDRSVRTLVAEMARRGETQTT